MFSNFFLKSFRIVLLPLALVYWVVIAVRNFLYDQQILKSARFGLPLICVGNLSVGGTGKSPMVEYLVSLLKKDFRIATLSRGYKRKTRGYALANEETTALEIGDEPMLFHLKFPDIPVAVGEERMDAIPQLLHDRPALDAIILDDAFQHRAITAGFNILLTEYHNLFTRDFYLPTGDLRDQRSSRKRADVIVVTKCDPGLSEAGREKTIREINPGPQQRVFFTTIVYDQPYQIIDRTPGQLGPDVEVLLVTGIANPAPLKKFVEERSRTYFLQQYPDHHIFTIDDLREIKRKFEQLGNTRKLVLTTEKDAVRLHKFDRELSGFPLYVIPVRHDFLFEEASAFNERIIQFIRNFPKTPA